ncbi:MAG: hypothetical protein ACLGG7_08655 [Bacteriovoracia bacterium]
MIWRALDLLHALFALVLFPLRFTAWGRARVRFEEQRDPPLADPDWTFEVSSEGEFEQIRPWLEELLGQGKKIELLFASPSVDRRVRELKRSYPTQIRLFPLPLLTHTPWVLVQGLRAPRFVLCRYDFFPSLMARTTVATVVSGVVWASFIGKRHRLEKRFWREFYRWFYGVFTWLVPATHQDELSFNQLCSLKVFPTNEMRVPQIVRRLERGGETLHARCPHWPALERYLATFPRHKRWIIGSAWEEDLGLLDDPQLALQVARGEAVVLVVPHQLGEYWRTKIKLPVCEVSESWSGEIPPGHVILVNLKGVLCELYAHVGCAYVGGGFGRSVHSVMEPFVAGAQVLCGPHTHRSTEVEMIQGLGHKFLRVIPDQASLARAFSETTNLEHDLTARQEWLDNQVLRLKINLAEVAKLC